MSLANDIIKRGTRAAQPAAASVTPGALYGITDEGNIIERSTGAAWEAYSPGAGATSVTAASVITDNAIVRGDGGARGTQLSLITISDTGALTLPDNIRQTFNPGADAAGLNVGAIAGDPGTPSNGDLWYDSTANELTARINGASVALGAASAGGGLVLLETRTASASASLNFTTCISSTYDDYLIKIGPLIPATNGAQVWIRVSTDGGATYDSGTNYEADGFGWRYSVSPVGIGGGINQAQIDITGTLGQVNTSSQGLTATVELFNPLSAATVKAFHCEVAGNDGTSTLYYGAKVMGRYVSATAVNAFQVLCSSGNITSGTVRVYGYAK